MASDSSAKAGSNVLSGKDASPLTLFRAESRNEDRDEGRSGVVGRDVRVRELDRFALESPLSPISPEDIGGFCGLPRDSTLVVSRRLRSVTEVECQQNYRLRLSFAELDGCWLRTGQQSTYPNCLTKKSSAVEMAGSGPQLVTQRALERKPMAHHVGVCETAAPSKYVLPYV